MVRHLQPEQAFVEIECALDRCDVDAKVAQPPHLKGPAQAQAIDCMHVFFGSHKSPGGKREIAEPGWGCDALSYRFIFAG
jgi:hypothetical protein